MAAPKQAKVLNVDDVRKFVEAELEETETALGFVLEEIAKGSSDYGRVYARKKAEYEGTALAYRSVLDVLDGK